MQTTQVMQSFTNRELFRMNGGVKRYIYTDGFGDVYSATAEEETKWTRELIAEAIIALRHRNDLGRIRFAIDHLLFFQYAGTKDLLMARTNDNDPLIRIACAAGLWIGFWEAGSVEIIIAALHTARILSINAAFDALEKFRGNETARGFLEDCTKGTDQELVQRAAAVLHFWSRFITQPVKPQS